MNFLRSNTILFLSRTILGGLFIYSSIDKIYDPVSFAQIIHHYRITPPGLINYIAIILPWIELLAGVFLIIGYKVKGSVLTINGMLVFFAVLLTITAFRGINVACGCFSSSMATKSNLIIRIIQDIGMLILGLHILIFYREKKESAG
jgi:uncharacterized membrane protein YphA (DoxX/SURF4 family)